MDFEEIIKFFNENHDENNLKTMKRLKAGSSKTYGIKIPVLRKLSKDIGTDHKLSIQLWNHGYHDSRILATLIEDPNEVTENQLDLWVHDFDNWDIVDQACINILYYMPSAIDKIPIWAKSEEKNSIQSNCSYCSS